MCELTKRALFMGIIIMAKWKWLVCCADKRRFSRRCGCFAAYGSLAMAKC